MDKCSPSALSIEFPTIVEVLRWRTQFEQRAYSFLIDGEIEGPHLTYRELDYQARTIAALLQKRVASGARVLLLYPPGLEYVAAFFGCLYAGVIAVPAYPPRNRSLPRLQAIIEDSRATVALTTAAIQSNIERQLPHTPSLEALCWLSTDDLADEIADTWQEPRLSRETLALLQYTSGSTGTPKGVMVSHGNLLHNSALIQSSFENTSDSHGVIWLPSYHDMGLVGGLIQPLYSGFPVTLMSPVDFLQKPWCWLQAVSRYRATTSGGPNFAYDLCVRTITDEQRQKLDLSNWKVAFTGAEPVRAETLEQFAAAFHSCGFHKSAFYPCYGMAETTLIISGGLKAAAPVFEPVAKAALEENRVVSAGREELGVQTLVGCGRPLQNMQVAIADPQTLVRCAPNQVGEIWVAGPSVAQGYWNKTQETELTFQAYLADTGEGPFLRTGDLGFLKSGELFIVGRLKDLIIIRGRNYYPQDIERTVEQSHPALQVNCGAAFSVEVAGVERLVVIQEVQRTHLRQLDTEGVVRAIRQAVAESHELQVYSLLLLKTGSIPKTSSGKIQRHACKASFLDSTLSVIASATLENSDSAAVGRLNRETLLALGAESRYPQLESYLQEQAARILRVVPSSLSPQQPLSAFGLDSLMVVELKNSIEVDLGIVLPIANFFNGLSIAQLAAEVLIQLTAPTTSTPRIALVSSADRSVEYRLSYGQRSLWFLHQLAPESSAYNIAAAAHLRADLDVPALHRAFQKLLERHAALRTTVTTACEEPVGQIHAHMKVCFQQEDASDWSETCLQERLDRHAYHPFDLAQGPLLRVNLFTRSAQEHVLLLVVHHIVADFWSLTVFVHELGILYQAEKTCTPAILPSLALQYTDYVRWQEEMLASQEGERLWAYWQKQLVGELPVLNLHTDRPRPLVQTYRGDSVPFQLSASLTQKLKAIASAHKTTLYTTLLAAFQVLLYRYTGQEDILVGSPTAGRNQANLANLVGYFVNPLVFRANLSGNPTFEVFLEQVRQTVLDGFEHQFPFALLVERLQPVREASRSPLFQVMFVLQKAYLSSKEALGAFALGEGARIDLGELQLESMSLEEQATQFDLTLMIAESTEGLTASLKYNTDLFAATTITRMAEHFQTLLAGIVACPEQRISALPLLSETERHQLLVEWNATQIEYPSQTCIHELFAAQVERSPDAVAAVCEEQRLTYRELNCQANQLAQYLKTLGIGPDVLVGICVERSLLMLIGLLGILKAGGAYVPLDPDYPKERLAFMLEDAQVPVLLTHKSLLERIPDCGAKLVCLDSDWQNTAPVQENLVNEVTADRLAYVIYTSGSTGKPKGVQISHRAVANFLHSMQKQLGLTNQDVLLAVTSLSFDIAALELFLPLMVGARVVVVGRSVAIDGKQLASLLADGATVMQATPATWRLLLAAGWQGSERLKVLCGGESLSADLAEQLLQRSDCLWNLYGPTETTVWSTAYKVEHSLKSTHVGRPIANTQVYLLDSQQQPVPIGVPGELYISGAGLARGYLNRPELTAEKFIANAFSKEPSCLYRTGDLARYLPDGNIQLLGRVDHQVKVRGFRIELGEIETALCQYPTVREAVVVAREDLPGDKRLVAYITGDLFVDRIPLQSTCLVECNGSPALALKTVDLSLSGICLVDVPLEWKEDQHLCLRLQLPGVQEAVRLQGIIVWRRLNYAGILFKTEPDEQALLRQSINYLVKSADCVVRDLRRSQPRILLQNKCLVEFESGHTLESTVQNISYSGIHLVAASNIWKEEQHLRLRLQLPGVKDELWLRGVVTWHSQEHAGIRFESASTEQLQIRQSIERTIEMQELSLTHLLTFLKGKLPEYMVPNTFVLLENLPLTPNGKIDRRTLPAPTIERSELAEELTIPHTPVEKLLSKLWAESLGLEIVGIHDNFFDLGGHSLQASQLVAKMSAALNTQIPIKLLFVNPTIAELSIALTELTLTSDSKQNNSKDVGDNSSQQLSPYIQIERRPLLSLFATGKIAPVDAAALAYLPNTFLDSTGLNRAKVIDEWCHNLPLIYDILETSLGRFARIMLPRFDSELYNDQEGLLDEIIEALEVAKRIGAQTVSLTGLIPSATDYGREITAKATNRILPAITTGHATTIAAVILSIKKILQVAKRDLSEEKVGFLGLGSIGSVALQLMLKCLPHPTEIILCDIYSKLDSLEKIKKELVNNLGFRGTVRVIESKRKVPVDFYNATLIVGAANVPNILDIEQVKAGTMIVDDSAPHCYSPELAIQRFEARKDIIFTEGGLLQSPQPIKLLKYWPNFIAQSVNIDYEKTMFQYSPFEIMGCGFSSLLSSRFKQLKPTIGLVDEYTCLQHYEALEQIGFQSASLRCGQYVLADEKVQAFRKHFGTAHLMTR